MILSACKNNQFLSKAKALCHKNHTANPFFTHNNQSHSVLYPTAKTGTPFPQNKTAL